MLMSMRAVSSQGKAVHYTEDVNVSELLKGKQQLVSHSPVHVELQAEASSGVVAVQGKLTLDVEMNCSRCLASVQRTLDIPFHEIFTQKPELMPRDEQDEMHLVSEDPVDLMPFVEEAVSLAFPYIPLCSEECLGLCPECGQNRNEQTCNCTHNQPDLRLAGLADFFQKAKL